MADEPLAPPHKSILGVGQRQVIESVSEDDKAAAVVTADPTGVRAGVAVDVGKGFKAGAEVEKTSSGWGWFVGGLWRKKKR